MVQAGHWRDQILLDHLARHLAHDPAKTALFGYRAGAGAPVELSYGQIDSLSSRLAVAMHRIGVRSGQVISMQLPNWWQAMIIHLACLKIGAITNPLMPILRDRELGFILGKARSRLFFVPELFKGCDYPDMGARLKAQLPDMIDVVTIGSNEDDGFHQLMALGENPGVPCEPLTPARPDDIIELLFTSGTTGEPKGVMHSSNTMMSNLASFATRLGLNENDIVHMPSPIGHQLGFMYGLILPVMLGATTVLQDIFDPQAMAVQIEAHRVSFTMAAPPFLADFVDHIENTGGTTDSLRIFVSAGAPVARSLVARSRDILGASVISGWGMSENGAVTITRPSDDVDKVTATDGFPLDGMEIDIRREDDSPANIHETGRLFVRGCSNFLGYFDRPDLVTLDADGWFDTGDFARVDADGYVRITGRSKDIIIRGGENIPVVEIEDLIVQHPAVHSVAVVAVPHDRLGEQAFAFVVSAEDADFDMAAMRAHLKATGTAVQYFPEYLKLVDALPTTLSGKVQKFVLRDWAKAEMQR